MADTSIKNRKTFIAFSPTPGGYPFGGANLRFQDLSIDPTPMIDKTAIKPKGNTFASGSQRGLEFSDHALSNANFGFYNANYLMEMLVGAGDKTTLDTGIFQRVYEPITGTPPRDVALDYGDPAIALERYLYVFLTGLGLKGDLKTITWSGAGKGKEVTYLGAGEGAASVINIPLAQANPPTDGLYLASTYGGLGSPGASTPAPADRFMSIDWACGALLDVIASKKPGIRSWRKPLETDSATGDVTIELGDDTSARGYLDEVREDEIVYGRYEITGRTLKPGTPEVQTIDLSADDDPTGGTWTLTILGVTLTGIPGTVSAAELQQAIRALDAYGAADVTVSKVGFVYTITFPDYLGNVTQMTSSGAGLSGVGEQQTVDLSGDDDPTGGDWDLTILGETIAGIAWNVTAAALQTAIRAALVAVTGASQITVSKVGFVYTITFPFSLGNVATVTTDNGAGLTGGGGDTFAITVLTPHLVDTFTITHATTTPGVVSIRELFALDFAGAFSAHFGRGEAAPLSLIRFSLWLVENADITGWRVTTITDMDDLSLAA